MDKTGEQLLLPVEAAKGFQPCASHGLPTLYPFQPSLHGTIQPTYVVLVYSSSASYCSLLLTVLLFCCYEGRMQWADKCHGTSKAVKHGRKQPAAGDCGFGSLHLHQINQSRSTSHVSTPLTHLHQTNQSQDGFICSAFFVI